MTRDTEAAPLAEVLAEHGRPVTEDGIERARRTRARRAEERDNGANAVALARLRAA
ncbi:hypothetical protein [Symbioplanes lichenis]|uniref:hypothetical protein n=1 Tax=Symbioplanes lichenis TaxID=1629072 RepID=UPI002738D653|nr:hypothetical protein [Actinoplanes lichenis]